MRPLATDGIATEAGMRYGRQLWCEAVGRASAGRLVQCLTRVL